WSPDSTKIVTGGSDDIAIIWDAETGEERLTLSGHDDHIYSVAWSPDGLEILTASDDKTARTWNAETGEPFFILEGHTDYVNSAAWSPDGLEILTVSDDKTARIWDAETGLERLRLSGHTDPIWEGDWSPDGAQVITVSSDGTVRLWDVTKPEDPRTFAGYVAVPAVSPDKTLVASAEDDWVNIADAVTGETRYTFTGHDDFVNTIVWSADGQKLITSSDDQTVKIWEAATGRVLLNLTDPDVAFIDAGWSPDGKYIVTQTDYPSDYNYQDQLWDAATGEERLRFFTDGRPLVWSADGTKFGVHWVDDETETARATVWDVADGEPVLELEDVSYRAWSADGTRLVGEYNDGDGHPTAAIWDGESGELIM
ncbi:MAG: hypothetical protein K8I30_13930, partial [Anaerolineae bacterium]|nr:hypothetical protein [Anaerolineae bacterium]